MDDKQSAEQFWFDREKEIGRPIIFKTMAQMKNLPAPLAWSLFYATDRDLYFQYFSNYSSLFSMFKKRAIGEDSVCQVEKSVIREIEFFKAKTFLKVFLLNPTIVIIRFNNLINISNNHKTDILSIVPVTDIPALEENLQQYWL